MDKRQNLRHSIGVLLIACSCSALLGFFVGRKDVTPGHYELTSSDTIRAEVYDSIPRLVVEEETGAELRASEPVPVLTTIDTAAVVEAHYKRHRYLATYQNEEIRIKWDMDVFKNTLDPGALRYQLLKPVAVTTVTNQVTHRDRFQIYAGTFGGMGDRSRYLGPTLHLIIKERTSIGISYNLLDPGWNLGVNVNWRIK